MPTRDTAAVGTTCTRVADNKQTAKGEFNFPTEYQEVGTLARQGKRASYSLKSLSLCMIYEGALLLLPPPSSSLPPSTFALATFVVASM